MPHPNRDKQFTVRAWYTEADDGETFGPFNRRDGAEACVLVLAARPDVIRATIETEEE